MNNSIRDCIAFIQNRTGSWGLPPSYVSTSIGKVKVKVQWLVIQSLTIICLTRDILWLIVTWCCKDLKYDGCSMYDSLMYLYCKVYSIYFPNRKHRWPCLFSLLSFNKNNNYVVSRTWIRLSLLTLPDMFLHLTFTISL